MDKYRLKEVLNSSFLSSLNITANDNFHLNALKSAKFVSTVGHSLFNEFYKNTDYTLNVIPVDDQGNKLPGEWLLDVAITQNVHGFRKKIILAVESESSTSIKAFNDDFAKLVHIRADNYIYLNGLDQKTEKGKQDYTDRRLLYAKNLLSTGSYPSFYLGFWASPKKIKGYKSIWAAILDGEFSHLKKVELYKYQNGDFIKV
ncbi:hypothetical protein D1164_04515 [Mariniphaga sediminis]|uniref:Uncharacterized protein n=1 Tax=Mariniphaga sediminis TaxID=1628158 RepID=A0A399D3G4_9BACT|nr:hypothetical protein [Mariniphaga sediminis]RIH66179.1 hypothetical protein D1164_04515 [Mariniphaga sediminis]